MDKRILFLITLLFSPVVTYAADVSGFVRNANNQPLPGAKVDYKCKGATYSAVTNQYGRYRVSGLPDVKFCDVTVNGKSMPRKINSGSGSKEVDLRY